MTFNLPMIFSRLQTMLFPISIFACGLLPLVMGCQTSGKSTSQNCNDPSMTYTAGQQGNSNPDVRLCGSDDCERPADFGLAAVPAPPGTYVNRWTEEMICGARRYDFVISRHEWFSGGGELGPEGRQHIARITEALPYRAEHVIIEAEPIELQKNETLDNAIARTEGLNEQRRQGIVNFLIANEIHDAEQRVTLAPLDRVGVRGVEAPQVYNQILRGGSSRGGQQGGFGGGQGGSGFGGGTTGGGGGFF